MSENSNRKGNTILLTVIAVATLLVAVVGATFAYFTASVSGNESAKSVIVNAATIGTITFADGQEIDMENVLPGTEKSKDFTIKASTNNPEGVKYAVTLNIAENTFDSSATDLIYSLTGSASPDQGTAFSVEEGVLNGKTTKFTCGSGTIKGENATHTYHFTIRFREMGSDQNSNQGKKFRAAIQVTTSDNGDIYYTSANPEGTSQMPGSDAGISSDAE